MTEQRPAAEILAERLTVVLAIGEANGAHQRAQAGASGAQIEVMTLEDHGADDGQAAALAAARARDAAAQARLADAAARIGALDDRLAVLDRELAAAGPG